MLRASLRKCKRLRVLNLGRCKQVDLNSFTALFEEIKPEQEKDGGREEALTGLKELVLRDCDSVCDNCLACLGVHLTSLESLDLSNCISVTSGGLRAISERLHHLKHLKLQQVNNISLGIGYIASGCIGLKSLDISFCDWVDDVTVEAISQSLLNETLENLDISRTRISDEGINTLSRTLYCLKHLWIKSCHSLTDKSLLHISKNLTNLVNIDIFGCAFSDVAVNAIRDSRPSLIVQDWW